MYDFGKSLREFLGGLSGEELSRENQRDDSPKRPGGTQVSTAHGQQRIVWGNYVDPSGLPHLYKNDGAPDRHTRKQHPPAGIDNLALSTVDVFHIPGRGEFKVDFSGYFQVTRSNPSTPDWETATVYVNFTDLKLFGKDEKLGSITVDLNPNVVSAGNTFPAKDGISNAPPASVACKINVAARFHLADLGLTLFNKTPVALKNTDVQGIPTIGEGGAAEVYAIPLYDWENPDGALVGYLTELTYLVRNYLPKAEVARYRAARTEADFVASA